jgi:hypothetical protein
MVGRQASLRGIKAEVRGIAFSSELAPGSRQENASK